MTDDYAFWRASLEGKTPDITSEPQVGFYRKRKKEGGFLPVAIWEDKENGCIACLIGDKEADAHDIWSWVADKPVSEEAYRKALETGQWDDVIEVPASEGDDWQSLAKEVDNCVRLKYEVLSQPLNAKTAKKAAQVCHALKSVSNRAKDGWKEDKDSLKDKMKAFERKWQPTILCADDNRGGLIEKIGEFADANGLFSVGNTGSKISSRLVKSAQILDFDAAAAAFKQTPEMQELVQKLADRAYRAGKEVAGCVLKTERIW